jgi:hypothetical protein
VPWYAVTGVTIVALVAAIIEGGKMWAAPAIVVPLGAAWIAIDRYLASRRTTAIHAAAQTGARHRRQATGAERALREPASGVRSPSPSPALHNDGPCKLAAGARVLRLHEWGTTAAVNPEGGRSG